MKTTMLRQYLSLFVAIVCSSLSSAWAASITNNGTGGALNTGGAWVGGVVPGSADIAVWDATVAANGTSALGANTNWAGIQILNPAVPVQISAGNTLSLGTSGIDMSAATMGLTLANPVALIANQSWLVTNGQALTVNGVVSGTNFLTLNGGSGTNGNIILNAANTYTGGTRINGGMVTVLNNAAFGANAGGLTNAGGILFFGNAAGGITIGNPLTFINTNVIDMNVLNAHTGNNTFALPMSGNGTIIISNLQGFIADDDTTGIETLTLGSGAAGQTMNNFSGNIIIASPGSDGNPTGGNLRFNGGGSTINVGSTTASFDLGSSSVAFTVRSGGTINLGELKGGPFASLYSSRSTASSQTTWSIGGKNTSTTFSGKIRNFTGNGAAGSFTSMAKVGTGILTLSGTNTYTGITTINGGFLNAGIAEDSGNAFGPFGEPTTAVGSIQFGGGGIQYSSVNQYDYSSRFDDGTLGNQPISIDLNGQNVTFASSLAGAGTSLAITNSTGSGTLTLTTPESYDGATLINRGKLVISSSGALPAATAISIGTGGTLDVSAQPSPFAVGAGFSASGAGTTVGTTAATVIPAAGGIFDLGSQPVALTWGGISTGTDSTHPAMNVSPGTLKFNNNIITLIVPGAGLVPGVYTLVSAAAITGTPNSAPDFTGGNGLAFGCTGIITVSGGNSVVLTVAQTANVSSWNNGSSDGLWSTVGNWDTSLVPHLAGDVGVFGSAVSTLVTLNAPEIVGATVFTNSHSYIISGANTLTLDNNNNGAGIVATDGTSNKIATAVSLNDNVKLNVSAGKSLDIAGVIANAAGAKTVEFAGLGTNIVENANTYGPAAGTVGSTLSGGGILQVGGSASLGAGDLRVINGTLKSGAAGLTLANNIAVDPAATATLDAGGNTFTIGGVVSGDTGKLTVTGSGTVLLNGVNTRGGITTINSGAKLKIGGAGQLGGGTYAANITDNGILDYNSSVDQSLTGVISGTGKVVQDGAGMLTLNSANTYTGGTTNTGGTLTLINAASAGTGTITLTGGTLAFGALTFANPVAVTGTTPIISNTSGGAAQFNGAITGSGTLNVDQANGAATLTLGTGGMAAFTGTVKVSDTSVGYMRFSGSSGSTGATFDFGNSTVQFFARSGGDNNNLGALIGGPNTQVGGARSAVASTTYYIGDKNLSTTFNGIFTDGNAAGTPVNIVKRGTGTLTLGGVNTYTGSTIVSNGTLALINVGGNDAYIGSSISFIINTNATLNLTGLTDPTLTLNSGQTLAGGGTLLGKVVANGGSIIIPGSAVAAGTLTVSNLTETGSVINRFALATIGSTNSANTVISVQGNLDVSGGTQTISLNGFGGGAVTNGTYPLFTYTGTLNGGTNNFIVQPVGVFPYTTTLTNDTASKQIAVIITSARATTNLVWQGDGANNYWDTLATGDWLAGGSPITFESGDKVFFTDAGSPNTNVTIQGVGLYPGSVVVSNSTAKTYTFSGPGDIAGTIGLIKTNSGTLFINNNNTYTGPTIFGGGTVSISTMTSNGIASPIGAANNNAANLLFAGGTLAFTGSDAATDRGLTVTNGGGTISVIDGTTLTINGLVAGTNAGNATLTKTGPGTLVLGAASSFTANIVINGGILSDTNAQNSLNPSVGGLGNPQIASRSITVNNGGILSLDADGGNDFGNGSTSVKMAIINNPGGLVQVTKGNVTLGPLTFNGGTLDAVGGSGVSGQYGPYAFSGTVTVGGTAPSTISSSSSYAINLAVNGVVNQIFNVADATGNPNPDLTVSAVLGDSSNFGVAGLIKTGAGTLTLSAPNSYSGPTIVSNGVLQVTSSVGPGTNQSTSVVNVYGGQLAGSGSINGAVTNWPGGTIAPGAGSSAAGTTLSINANVTMLSGSTLLMQISHSASDQISVAGPVIYGGVLMVSTNAGDSTAYAVGQNFTLFNAGGGASGTFDTIQPPPGPGLGWSQTASGITVVSATTPVVANFTGSTTNGLAPLPVTFANSSSGASYWSWNFGDGSTLTTNASSNVSHTYTSPGSYTVTLTAYGVAGSNALVRTSYISVTAPTPVIGSTVLSGNSLIVSGSGGAPGGQYRVLTTANLTNSIANWTPVRTNVFDGSGNFSYTNAVLTNSQAFFRIASP